MDANLTVLFEEEDEINHDIRRISEALLELSEYVTARSALELAAAEVAGKRIRVACDAINDEVHRARKKLGILMTQKTKVLFKKREMRLTEMENDLAHIHGDIESIGDLALEFYRANDRNAAFQNLNSHYSELVRHVMNLMVDEVETKKLIGK